MLSFLFPFANITPWIDENSHTGQGLTDIIPAWGGYAGGAPQNTGGQHGPMGISGWLLLLFIAGGMGMLFRLLQQYISLRRLRRQSLKKHTISGIVWYETPAAVMPFSFGNAIYICPAMHTPEELQRIVQHEFVHVKQKHTIDLVIAELLCVVNWFNPFAWLIRHAMRQNLEFIADSRVLASGLEKKEYQHLLLKVMGAPQYAIASHFNFSNLKKRIIMMNKMKSTRLHLTRFLLVLPMLGVLLLAFRKKEKPALQPLALMTNVLVKDTIPAPPPPPPALPQAVKNIIIKKPGSQDPLVTVLLKNGRKEIYDFSHPAEKSVYTKKYGSLPGAPPPPPVPAVPAAPSQPPAGIADPAHPVNPPLYIVDGVEKPNISKENSIPANQIKTVYVLKGDSALSKYGEKGKNGVVEIITEKPLVIVDSMIQPPSFDVNQVNPDKIKTMQVLKDEATAAKYGARGKNGVIEITTKPAAGGTAENSLIILDGKEMPAGTRAADVINPDYIEKVNVLKGNAATVKYGDKAAKGAIEITTKKRP